MHFLFLHQTTTFNRLAFNASCCFYSCFYIKPQRRAFMLLIVGEIDWKINAKNQMFALR